MCILFCKSDFSNRWNTAMEVSMNHKKSMRIFWLSLFLLVAAGTAIIAVVQYQSHRKEIGRTYGEQENDGRAVSAAQPDTEPETAHPGTMASAIPHPQMQRENTTADPQTQPVNGNAAEYRFELKVVNGYLDVYHYHTDNLFFHTGIPYSETTVKQRQELESGKYFINEQDRKSVV